MLLHGCVLMCAKQRNEAADESTRPDEHTTAKIAPAPPWYPCNSSAVANIQPPWSSWQRMSFGITAKQPYDAQ
eukprot:scaffold651852_cov52-Prasinocladus_malaysianus.AAC.1